MNDKPKPRPVQPPQPSPVDRGTPSRLFASANFASANFASANEALQQSLERRW